MSIKTINAVGRRKTSVARVYLSEGKGDFVVNGRELRAYFPSELLVTNVNQPLVKLGCADAFNIKVNVKGGGVSGQADAIKLGIARALCELDPANRPSLKEDGLLTRDPREVERKKYGQKKARKRFQFSKR